MKKLNRYLIFFCIIFLFFIININTTKAATTTISSIQELYATRSDLSANYELGINLDFNGDASYDATIPDGYESVAAFKTAMTSGTGWLPIGDDSSKFTGNFDGGGHTISNLFINRPSTEFIGLFGKIDSGSGLMNVSLENIDIKGQGYTGGLVGYMDGATSYINNSYTTGSVQISENSDVGGLVGRFNNGTISNSYSSASVTGTYDVGGLVGFNAGTITDSYATGNVNTGITTIDLVGGLVGYNYGDISSSYATGNVGGDDYIGGLVGGTDNGNISNSFATGDVTGADLAVGGLLGYIMDSNLINSYSTGRVSGLREVGGLIGGSYGGSIIETSYYDSQTSGQSDNDGRGIPRTTAEMTYPYDETSTTTYVGWDFDTIWYHDTTGLVNNGYPYNYYIPDTTAPVISGLSNDTTPTKSKTWSWDSDDESATYRYTVNQDSSYTFEDQEYGDTKTATQSSGDGTYYLHVQAKDTSDNTSTSTVSAILDNTAPTIAILGSNPVYTFINESYTDSGATASDAVDGDITSGIVVTNTVDTSTVGTHYVTYVVSDTAGNTSTST
ncbi:MAG TPA: GLUG motif-containing protein, partial [bacterium]|nr:GLUG motif-containing protein [bacterium]